MSDKRITVEEVRAAIEKTGMSLIAEDYYSNQGTCGCPIAILHADNCPDTRGDSGCASDWADAVYGVYYHTTFTRGFDGCQENPGDATSGERWRQGYADGQACRVLLAEQETS